MQTNSKEVVLIGGLPCSGKTTCAKEDYPDHFLIDDPVDIDRDVLPHIERDRVVVTDPYLSFREHRAVAEKFFEDRGFEITTVILDVSKSVLLEREKLKGGRKEFITHFKLEK